MQKTQNNEITQINGQVNQHQGSNRYTQAQAQDSENPYTSEQIKDKNTHVHHRQGHVVRQQWQVNNTIPDNNSSIHNHSLHSRNKYRELVNEKLYLEDYYKGPPKYSLHKSSIKGRHHNDENYKQQRPVQQKIISQSKQNIASEDISGGAHVLNLESQTQENLIQSVNYQEAQRDAGSQNKQQDLQTQHRIDLTNHIHVNPQAEVKFAKKETAPPKTGQAHQHSSIFEQQKVDKPSDSNATKNSNPQISLEAFLKAAFQQKEVDDSLQKQRQQEDQKQRALEASKPKKEESVGDVQDKIKDKMKKFLQEKFIADSFKKYAERVEGRPVMANNDQLDTQKSQKNEDPQKQNQSNILSNKQIENKDDSKIENTKEVKQKSNPLGDFLSGAFANAQAAQEQAVEAQKAKAKREAMKPKKEESVDDVKSKIQNKMQAFLLAQFVQKSFLKLNGKEEKQNPMTPTKKADEKDEDLNEVIKEPSPQPIGKQTSFSIKPQAMDKITTPQNNGCTKHVEEKPKMALDMFLQQSFAQAQQAQTQFQEATKKQLEQQALQPKKEESVGDVRDQIMDKMKKFLFEKFVADSFRKYDQRLKKDSGINQSEQKDEMVSKIPPPETRNDNNLINNQQVKMVNIIQTSLKQKVEQVQQEILQSNWAIIQNQKKFQNRNNKRQKKRVDMDDPQNILANKNQNYTKVPNNTQASAPSSRNLSPNGQQKSINFENMKQPDEDDRDCLNLYNLNSQALKTKAERHNTILHDVLNQKATILQRLSATVKNELIFTKKPIRVFSIQDFLQDGRWDRFVCENQDKIQSKSIECVVVFSSPQITCSFNNQTQMESVELIFITNQKICKIRFVQSNKEVQWSHSTDNDDELIETRLNSIYEMLNGKTFATKMKQVKLGFMFGASQNNSPQKTEVPQEIEKPIKCTDNVHIQNDADPLYALFAFTRYYVYLEKYKAIVKYNLVHAAYTSKKNELLQLIEDPSLRDYWSSCIFSICAN